MRQVQPLQLQLGKIDIASIQFDPLTLAIEDKTDLADVKAYRERKEEIYHAQLVNDQLDGSNPIKVFRNYPGMTQQTLVGAINKSKVYIAKLQPGERKGTTDVISDIARALNMDIDELS